RSGVARIGDGVCGCAAEAERRQDGLVTVDRQYRSVIFGRWHRKQRWQTRLQRALFARLVVQREKRIGVPAFGDRDFVDQRRRDRVSSRTRIAVPPVRMIDGRNARLAQHATYVRSEWDPLVELDRVVIVVDPAEIAAELRRNIGVETKHVITPRV